MVPNISELACVNESIIKVEGKKIHQCTLIHWGSITEEKIIGQLIHKEHPEIKLIWRSNEQLQLKPLYPEGILDIIVSDKNDICHLLIEKSL